MHNIVHLIHRLPEPRLIAHIADEIPHTLVVVVKHLLHLELLQLVAGKYNDLLRRIPFQQDFNELFAERSCAASNQNRLIVKQVDAPLLIAKTISNMC